MVDFDLTQTDQQVQNILNDAQGAMGASAQTTLTTEYVMLKDTSGIYHKILKSSFTEAIRDVLAGLLVNNDKGTTINQIAAIASGDFGSITPANLASVLGGLQVHQISPSEDLNNITEQGIYYCSTGTPQNAPVGWATYIVLKGTSDGYKLQFALSRSDTAKVYYRVKVGINAWDDWAQFYNQSILTDSTILSTLASALGVIGNIKSSGFNGDLNTLTETGCYYFINSASNKPSVPSYEISNGELLVIRLMNDRYLQLAFRGNPVRFSIRNYWDNGWGDWKNVAFT